VVSVERQQRRSARTSEARRQTGSAAQVQDNYDTRSGAVQVRDTTTTSTTSHDTARHLPAQVVDRSGVPSQLSVDLQHQHQQRHQVDYNTDAAD